MDIAAQRPRNIWEPEARCNSLTQSEKEEFFPSHKGRPSKDPRWKQVCFECPVRLECLNYAIVHDEEGNWGGSTDRERKRLPRTFVTELKTIAKNAGWYEKHPDPLIEYQNHAVLSALEARRLELEWERPDSSSPLVDTPAPSLTNDQQRSLALLGFY